MVDNYSRAHQAFLQACARLSVLSPKQSIDVLASVQKKYGNDNDAVNDAAVRRMVDEINAKLTEREIEQRLNFVHFEWENTIADFLVFCNTFASVGHSPAYNEVECTYMKNVIEKIVMNETHSISLMMAVHLCSASNTQSQSTTKKVTKQRAEELLEEWSAVGYFMMIGDFITLGPRCIGEFRETFRMKFNNFIHSCHLCSEITLQPNFCPNDECEAALDKRCFKNYVTKMKKCPSCKGDWQEVDA